MVRKRIGSARKVRIGIFAVATVTPITFQRWAGGDQGELAAGEIDLASLEIAQLSNDPADPENGCLILDMEGGL